MQVARFTELSLPRLRYHVSNHPGPRAERRNGVREHNRHCFVHGRNCVCSDCEDAAAAAPSVRSQVYHRRAYSNFIQVRSSTLPISGIDDVKSGAVPPSRVGVQPGSMGAVVFARDVSPTYYPVNRWAGAARPCACAIHDSQCASDSGQERCRNVQHTRVRSYCRIYLIRVNHAVLD